MIVFKQIDIYNMDMMIKDGLYKNRIIEKVLELKMKTSGCVS